MSPSPISRGCSARVGNRNAQARAAPSAKRLKLILMLTLVMADQSDAWDSPHSRLSRRYVRAKAQRQKFQSEVISSAETQHEAPLRASQGVGRGKRDPLRGGAGAGTEQRISSGSRADCHSSIDPYNTTFNVARRRPFSCRIGPSSPVRSSSNRSQSHLSHLASGARVSYLRGTGVAESVAPNALRSTG